MIIRKMGFRARLNKPLVRDAIAYVEKHTDQKEGVILATLNHLFLGDFGVISKEDAQKVFPLLE